MNKFILGFASLNLLVASSTATRAEGPLTLPATKAQVLCTSTSNGSASTAAASATLQNNLKEQIENALASAKKEFLNMNYVLKYSLSAPSLGSAGNTSSSGGHESILCVTLTMEFSKE